MRRVSQKLSSREARRERPSRRAWNPRVVVRVIDDGGSALGDVRRFLIERYLDACAGVKVGEGR